MIIVMKRKGRMYAYDNVDFIHGYEPGDEADGARVDRLYPRIHVADDQDGFTEEQIKAMVRQKATVGVPVMDYLYMKHKTDQSEREEMETEILNGDA